MRQVRTNRRRIDRQESTVRRWARRHVCTRHAARGVFDVPAERGQLCTGCFEGAWVRA